MAAPNEMTIVIKAKDQATAVVRTIGGLMRTALGGAVTAVTRQVSGLFKSFFSLRALLVGGGFFALFSRGLDAIAVNAKKYEAVFSPEQQKRIDSVASAFNRLKASIVAVFGGIIANGADGIERFLNGIALWLKDAGPKFVEWARSLGKAVLELGADIAAMVRTMIRVTSQVRDLVSIVRGMFGGGIGQIASGLAGIGARELTEALKPSKPIPVGVPEEELRAFENFVRVTRDAKAANEGLKDSFEDLNKVLPQYLLNFAELGRIMADSITDGFFAIIDGTKSVADAFRSMVADILRQLGRLLLQGALVNLLGNLFGGGGLFQVGAPTFGQLGHVIPGRARGGSASSGRPIMVGENGPEVFVPGASGTVIPGAGMPSINVNIYSNGDPRQIAKEAARAVWQKLETSTAFGRKLRTA